MPAAFRPDQLEELHAELQKMARDRTCATGFCLGQKAGRIAQPWTIWSPDASALLSFALVVVTFNIIRLQILTKRDEIEVSKLIGATNGFIRRPFLYFGAIQGMAGELQPGSLSLSESIL